ncbi:MAG TPA: sigma-70 family RNA polymerase sigma factor [Ruminiclostridium sp.]|nr:sigma-70 family RNA polymerase sigma factor [Ruminiclostridium sp.]
MRIIKSEQFSDCMVQYERLIFTICFSFTKSYFDAEDLTQETFLSAYSHFDSFNGDNPKAWFTAIAANKCRDFLKSPARKTASLSVEELNLIEDESIAPEQKVIQMDSTERVHMLCSRLKEPYKTTATRYFCDNMKLSEMSLKTGQNLKTLETQLYRAKKLLKAMWKEEPI